MQKLMTATKRGNVGLSFVLASLMTLAVSTAPVEAQKTAWFGVINSGQEAPPNTNNSKALGVAFVTLDAVTHEICFGISYEDFNLSSAETGAHFHFSARAGADAPARIALPPGAPKNGCVTPDPPLTDQDVFDLFGGLWYVDVHTQMNPEGEIRGQLFQVGPVP